MWPAHCFTRRGTSPTHNKSMLNGGEHPRVLLPHPQPAHLMLGGKGHVGAGSIAHSAETKWFTQDTEAQLCKNWLTSTHPSLHLGCALHYPRWTGTSSRPITSPQTATSLLSSPPRSSEDGHLIRKVKLYTPQRDMGWDVRGGTENADIYKFSDQQEEDELVLPKSSRRNATWSKSFSLFLKRLKNVAGVIYNSKCVASW